MSGLTPVFGSAGVNPGRAFGEPDALKEALKLLKDGGCKNIDTATLYGKSEEVLGQAKAGEAFTIDTKTKGGFGGNGYATKEHVIEEAEQSKKLLGSNVDIFYIHAPDPEAAMESTLEGVNEVYKSGFFKRFGLSNYKAEDVQKVYDHCKSKGYPLPTVYQGNYSAVARKQEELLFPTLRKLGISFYAYSPIAGGFLTKTKEDVQNGKGRFDTSTPIGEMYGGMYSKPTLLEALGQWESIAKEEGIPRAEMAYRWVTYNSPLNKEHGDAIIFGASSFDQLKETLASVTAGPLSSGAAKKIDKIWEMIEHEAPLDNYHR